MFLSAKKVLELNEKHNLVEGLCERELQNPEGVGLDIRVGEVYRLKGDGFLGVEGRDTPDLEKIADIAVDENKRIIMPPGTYYMVKTIEKVTSPKEKIEIEEGEKPRYLVPLVFPRSTLQRCGIGLFRTKTDPGYSGNLVFGIANLGKQKFEFELGARMFNLVFETVVGDIERTYDGQWQGGRETTEGVEKQN